MSSSDGPAAEAQADSAFNRCFEAHHADILRFAANRVEDSAEAEDLLAETFAIAWRRRESIPEPALPWLYGVARRVLANRRRAAQRAQRLATRLAAEPQAATSDPGALVLDRSAVLAALAELSEPDREVLRLVAWDGLAIGEAASVVGCSRAAFRVRLHRARRRLERRLEAESAANSDRSDIDPRPQEGR